MDETRATGTTGSDETTPRPPGERIADVAGNDAKTALSVYRRRMGPVVDDAVEPMDDLFDVD